MGNERNKTGEMEAKTETWRGQLRAMNERFEERLDESVFEGVRDERVHHGLKLTASTVLYKSFVDLCFCDRTKEYLVLEKGVAVHRYSMQGKLLQPSFSLEAQQTFTRMIWCDGATECLACYDPDGEQIWIMTSSCVLLQTIKNEFLTRAVFHDRVANQIVVFDTHQSLKYPLDEAEVKDLESTKALSYSDPEFGPTWQLDHAALVPQQPSQALLAASHMAILYLVPLDPIEDEEDEEGTGSAYLKRRLNATKAPITAVHFNASSSWVVVGDQQGNVTAWNLSLECVLSHGGAHDSRVRWLASHPSINGFLSYSHNSNVDSRLQVWSCNFRGKIESFCELGRVLGVAVVESVAAVVLLTAPKLLYLTMRQAYGFFAPLTCPTRSLLSSWNPMYRGKIVAASEDNSVRVFSPHGRQLNVQILPGSPLHVVASVYSGNRDRLYTIILRTGEILVSDASVCPMKFLHVFVSDELEMTCVAVYEYFEEIRDETGRPKKPRLFNAIRVRIVAGTKDGKLVVINENTGKHEYVCQAHNGRVIQLKSFVASQRVVSLGIDRSVKVWRVFADLANPLALYYTLNFTTSIGHVSLIGLILCMAKSSINSSMHQLLMEDMQSRVRLEHHNSKDHTELIVDVITSESLEICATSSLDNTIRIWDEDNCLLKILEINTCAQLAVFSSVLGDIVFNAGRHLYKIPHENYLSPKYRAKIVAKELSREADEDAVVEDPQYGVYDDIVDRNLMVRPVVSTPLASLDVTNSDKPRPDDLIRQQICGLYEYRDEDIRKTRDYQIEPRKRVSDRALMTTDVWNKYVDDLLSSMTRFVPEVPEYDFKNLKEQQSEEKKAYNDRGIFQMRFGYSPDEIENLENLEELMKDTKLPLHGFLPNSILYKRKEKESPIVYVAEEPIIKKEPVKYKYPREFYPEEEEEEEEEERRPSIRLSQLMGMDNANVENET
ncbi:WD repeat-containing protein 97-like [Copidosoma floridanum]|uniref:WD repeat-containing protein 97-like n=1 Tax=Copidosoma floridanum TaxID=29053 RepID=UPI000C6F48CB|nr:WD repeat-containing protein 97-like [Copidosoma floridanum]